VVRFTSNQRRQNTMQIFIDIVGNHDHVLIALINLPHSSSMYTFRAITFIESVSVVGFLRPQLKLSWGFFVIKHKLLARKQRLPLSLNINIIQAIRLHRSLMSRFEVLMFTKFGTSPIFPLMPLDGSTWQQQLTERRAVINRESALWHTDDPRPHNGHGYVV